MSTNFPAISSNGASHPQATPAAPRPTSPTTADPHERDQTLALGATEAAAKAADAWRRVASGAILGLVLATLAIVVLAGRYQHDVFVFRDTGKGLVYQGPAAQAVTPSQAAIEAQLGLFIKALRNVPGADYALVDQNVALARQMTVDLAPAHAHTDTIAYFTDKANNPKLLGATGFLRTVIDPVSAIPVSALTYELTWVEETAVPGHPSRRTVHQGVVTISPPAISTDPATVATNPAGVAIVQKELHL
ncbi:MAG: hypothetical protein NVS1B2_27260 [Vulcanimicrobiaceae bacterium]